MSRSWTVGLKKFWLKYIIRSGVGVIVTEPVTVKVGVMVGVWVMVGVLVMVGVFVKVGLRVNVKV